MNTVDLIVQKASVLPPDMQEEALHYVDYLLTRQTEQEESREWSQCSAMQLADAYSPADSVYDEE